MTYVAQPLIIQCDYKSTHKGEYNLKLINVHKYNRKEVADDPVLDDMQAKRDALLVASDEAGEEKVKAPVVTRGGGTPLYDLF